MTIRYRQLSPTGDYVFGNGPKEFLVDSPEAILQAIKTRLRLFEGQWFLDIYEGTPWLTKVLGENTQPFYDQAIRDRILGTQGVVAIKEYTSFLSGSTRLLTVRATVETVEFPGTKAARIGRLDIDFSIFPSDLNILG